jgi:hypothetical protein
VLWHRAAIAHRPTRRTSTTCVGHGYHYSRHAVFSRESTRSAPPNRRSPTCKRTSSPTASSGDRSRSARSPNYRHHQTLRDYPLKKTIRMYWPSNRVSPPDAATRGRVRTRRPPSWPDKAEQDQVARADGDGQESDRQKTRNAGFDYHFIESTYLDAIRRFGVSARARTLDTTIHERPALRTFQRVASASRTRPRPAVIRLPPSAKGDTFHRD